MCLAGTAAATPPALEELEDFDPQALKNASASSTSRAARRRIAALIVPSLPCGGLLARRRGGRVRGSLRHKVVCISRLDGARAEEVAQRVADSLGFRLIDEDIVARAAVEAGREGGG